MGKKMLALDKDKAVLIRRGLPVSMLEWIGDGDSSDKLNLNQ